MKYDEFKEELKAELEMRTGSKIKVMYVEKNNGVQLESFVFLDLVKRVSPSIYLEGLFQKYKEGTSVQELCDEIIKKKEEASGFDFDSASFFVYSNAKENIFPKVINFERNISLLNNAPHKRILDLAVVFYYRLPEEQDAVAKSILIKSEHLGFWNVPLEELYDTAIKNAMKKQNITIKSMNQIICELFGMEELTSNEIAEEPEMFVMSNESKLFGASGILQTDLLENFAKEKKVDLFILPSSIHELILIPMKAEIEANGLKEMVEQVNLTEVALEEQLSNQIYYYQRETNELKVL